MTDVVVVGAGVVGLTSALRLQRAGVRVTVLTASEPRDTVSSLAAAVWYPSHTSADRRALVWSRRTFDELAVQSGRDVAGVVMRPTRMLLRSGTRARPWWAAAVPDFQVVREPEVPAGFAGEWRFTVPTVEMVPYLDWLVEQVIAGGGTLVRHRLERLADAGRWASTIVNATGLAAGRLAADPAVYPVRGQIVRVTNPGLDVSMRDEQSPDGLTYVHPRGEDVVLGGTFEPDVWDTTVDDATSAAILRRCVALVPELAGATVLGQWAGLRPARHGGARVEAEWLPSGERLVHNYGHGGAGVTMAWGCADDVAELCR